MVINGISVNYIDTQIGKDVVLFLHGWQAPIETYQRIYDKLSTNYRVIALDTPGCGKTPEPPTGWSVDDYVDFVLAFCKELSLHKVILMGHSFGVRLMIKLMALHTDVLACEKAIIVDGAGITPKRSLLYYCKIYSYKLSKKIVATKIGNFFFAPLVEERKGNVGSTDYAAASPVMRRTLSLVVNEDLKHLMPKIHQETLLIWGENDPSTPLCDGITMERLIKNSALVTIAGTGHYPFLEQPHIFLEILDSFL